MPAGNPPHSSPALRIQRIERLYEISQILGTSLGMEELLQVVVDAACELSKSEGAFILVYEAETDLLKFVAGSASQKEVLKRIRVSLQNSVAGHVYAQSKPQVIQNAQQDPRVFKDIERAVGSVVTSLLAVPMIFRGDTMGVLEVINKCNNAHYTEDDRTILETLASQAALATLSTLMLEETRRAYKELEELEHKKSDFIAIASHELRTPLGLILGHSNVLRDSLQDKQLRGQVDVILRSANRLKKIIEDLSSVSAYQPSDLLEKAKVSISALLRSLGTMYEPQYRSKGVSLHMELPHQDLAVLGNAEKLDIALTNLFENAMTYTNKNGHVLVAAERLPGYVKVSIIDDGIGIPAKDLPHVFERFYQVESHLTRRHGGMGLGLAVTKTMIEMHNGQIWVESVEGKGSNFSFLLPSADEASQKVSPFEKASPRTPPFV